MRELLGLFERHRNNPVLLVVHSQADVDTIASALALKEYFPKGSVMVPDMLSSSGKRLNARFGGEVAKFGDAKPLPSAIIVLDTNSYRMLAGMADYVRGFKGEIAVIDHHSVHSDEIEAAHTLIENHASSTCEIVYEIFRGLNFPISQRNAELMLMGIAFDCAEFRNATTRTLEVVAYLLKRTKLSLAQVFALVESHGDPSQRIALLKCFTRLNAYRAGDYIFATSVANTHEAVAASKLVELGADYAFVAQETRNELRISARCRPELVDDRGADVAAILADVGRMIGGSGGGHAAAAGANGPRLDLSADALARCVELARAQVRASALEKISGGVKQ